MNAATIPPAPLTCARCGAEFGRDEAVAYLGERVVHARLDDCVAVFHRRITTLEAGNAELRERLEEALKYQSFWNAHFPGSNVVWPELVTVTTSASAIPWDTKWVRKSNGRLRPHGPFIPNADTPPPCAECGRPAEVEVAGEGHLRPLCWECSGCEATYWLPDRHRCYRCGKAASAQETGRDGLTRPYCLGCAGVYEDVR